MDKVIFRNAALSDAAQLVDIYRYYVEKTAISFEWTVPSVEEFRARMEKTMERYPYIVAVSGGRVIGYSYTGPFKERRSYDWCVETTIYLHPALRHHGVGKALYLRLEALLKKMHVLNLNACITLPDREDEYLTGNSARFHAHMGYHLVGEFHHCGFKFNRWYNMVWMEKMLGEHTDCPAPVVNYNLIRKDCIGTILTK